MEMKTGKGESKTAPGQKHQWKIRREEGKNNQAK